MLDMQEILSLIDSTNNRPLSVFKLKLYLLTKIFQVWLGQANVFGDATGEAKLAHLCVVCSHGHLMFLHVLSFFCMFCSLSLNKAASPGRLTYF